MDAPYQAREPGAATLATVDFDSTLAKMPDWLRKVKHWSGLLFLPRVSEAFASSEMASEKQYASSAFSVSPWFNRTSRRPFDFAQDRPFV